MANRIEVKPDQDGRIILELFGEKVEIDESMFKDGVATIKKFGDEYEIVKAVEKAAEPEEKPKAAPKAKKEAKRKAN